MVAWDREPLGGKVCASFTVTILFGNPGYMRKKQCGVDCCMHLACTWMCTVLVLAFKGVWTMNSSEPQPSAQVA